MMKWFLSALTAASLACASAETPALENELFGSPGSAAPNLARVGDSAVALTWLEPIAERRRALRFAIRVHGQWSEPRTIIESDSLFVNWADFPSLVALPNGSWIVHWLARVPGGTYAYHVRLAISRDRGKTWSAAITPHRDGTPQEHGFVSMVPWDDSTAAVVWLDGRELKLTGGPEPSGDMTLRFTLVSSTGRLRDEALLDGRTCECCQTALARTTSGLVAAYRDRSSQEIRDIVVARRVGSAWQGPSPAASDNWHFLGCPVNGPALAAVRDTVVLTWFTAPDGQARVSAAFSTDGGATWSTAQRVDDGTTLGRVSVQLLSAGVALVTWLETGSNPAEFRARYVRLDRRSERSWRITTSSDARSSGFLRSAVAGNEVVFAWTAERGIAVTARPRRPQ